MKIKNLIKKNNNQILYIFLPRETECLKLVAVELVKVIRENLNVLRYPEVILLLWFNK